MVKLPQKVQLILDKFLNAGYQIYIVGGAVRDLKINPLSPIKDWDFTTDATPNQILEIIPEGYYTNQFGTVGIPPQKPNQEILEITTMRKEGQYDDARHPNQVTWTKDLMEDLKRRDFTINAMALTADNRTIDPFNGEKDLKRKLIRAVGKPDARFKEDALRLVRAIRLAAQLGFDIETKTLSSIKQNTSLINKISHERIRDELFKILASSNPYVGIVKLREVGLLQELLPELERCFGILQEGPKHDRVYDIGEHSLLSLKHTPSTNPLTRLAALLHDVGKPDTYKKALDGNVTFYQHDVVGAKIAAGIARRLNLSKVESDKLYRLVRWHLFTVDENQTDNAIRRFIKNVGVENIDEMMAVRIGDRLGGGTQKAISWRMEKFQQKIREVLKKPFSVSDLKVNGYDVMEKLKLPPGPKVGQILNFLFQEVSTDASKNDREYLLTRIKSFKVSPKG